MGDEAMVENRKGCQLGTRRCDCKNLRELVHCLFHHSAKYTFGELAESLHVRRDALSRRTSPYGESDDASVTLTVSEAITSANLLDDTRVIAEMCRRTGGVYVAMPDVVTTDADVYEALTHAVEELGQDSGVIRQILSDRQVTSDEADRAEREIDETIAALATLKQTLRNKVQAKPVLATTRRLA